MISFALSMKWRVALSMIFAVALVATAFSVYRHKRFQHFAVHEPGMVYRSAWLEADAIAELIAEYQFRTVINLCLPGEMGNTRWEDERRAVSNAGARFLEAPMTLSIEPRDANTQMFIDIMRDPDNYPLLVHCQHGVTRTDKFLVIYDILFRGQSADESLNAMPLFGRDRHNVHVTAFARQLEANQEHFSATALRQSLSTLRH